MKDFLKFAAIGFAGNLFAVPLVFFGWGGEYLILLAFPIFLFLTHWVFRRYGNSRSDFFVLAGLFTGLCVAMTEVVVASITYRLQLLFLPRFSVHVLGIICGYLLWKITTALRVVPALIGALFAVLLFFQGADLWWHYANFGTFTGTVSPYRFEHEIVGIDQYNNKISNRDLENKVVLIDFWHTRCGNCFEKFPHLQAFFERNTDEKSLKIFALNKPLEEDKEHPAFEVIAKEGYTFPVLLPSDEDLPDKLGVTAYPTSFVIDTNGSVIYRGSIEGAMAMIESILSKGKNSAER